MRIVYGLVNGTIRPSLSRNYNIPTSVLKRPIGKKATLDEIQAVWGLKLNGCSMQEVSDKTGIPFNKVKLIWYYKNIDKSQLPSSTTIESVVGDENHVRVNE